MKASEASLLRMLSDKKQFVVPLYQRAYTWEHEACRRLWDDVIAAGRSSEIEDHVLGAIVSVRDGASSAPCVLHMRATDRRRHHRGRDQRSTPTASARRVRRTEPMPM